MLRYVLPVNGTRRRRCGGDEDGEVGKSFAPEVASAAAAATELRDE